MIKKVFVSLFTILLILFNSCQNNKNSITKEKKTYVLNEQKLSSESEEAEDYLIKSFSLNYSQKQIIYNSEMNDLDGDGENEKIKVVVFDEDFFKIKDIVGFYKANVIINGIPQNIILNWSNSSYYKITFKIIDIDKNDNLKELLVSQYEPEEEDPSQLHSVFRYFGNKLVTQTLVKSEGYSGGGLNFVENKLEVTHKNYPKTIGTYVLSNYFLNNTNMFVSEESEIPAACPYVYLKCENEFLYKGEIIRNLIGKNSESLQSLDLGYSKNEKIIIRIKEEKKEVSYLNFIAIEIDGKVILPLKNSKNTNLLFDDNKYIKLKKGDYIDIEFKGSKNSKINLIGKGYYIPIT